MHSGEPLTVCSRHDSRAELGCQLNSGVANCMYSSREPSKVFQLQSRAPRHCLQHKPLSMQHSRVSVARHLCCTLPAEDNSPEGLGTRMQAATHC